MGKGSVSKEVFINAQQAEHQMHELLIKDLNKYMTEVKLQVNQMLEQNQRANKSTDTSKLNDRVFLDYFPHK